MSGNKTDDAGFVAYDDKQPLTDDLLESYITYELALAILFIALVLDAVFGGLRKICTTGIPTLQVMFVFTAGQFFFFFVLWVVVGTNLISQSYGPQLVYAILAGVNVQIAEYLFTISCKFLKSSIATACVSIEFIFASFVLYAVLPVGIDIVYLSVGLLLIALGILSNLMPHFINDFRRAQPSEVSLADRPLVTVAHNLKQEDYDVDSAGNLFESKLSVRKRASSISSECSNRSSNNGDSTPLRAQRRKSSLRRRSKSPSARSASSNADADDSERNRDDTTAGADADNNNKGDNDDDEDDDEETEAETTALLSRKKHLRFSEDNLVAMEDEPPQLSEDDLAQVNEQYALSAEEMQPSQNVYWILVALSAGLLMSSWAIFTSLATLGDGGVSHTADLLFIFSSGQVLALPLLVLLFGYWDIVNMRQPLEKPFAFRDFMGEMGKMPGYIYLIILALSLVKDCYESAYFYVLNSGELPRAVVYATLSTIAPLSTLASLFLFREYDDEPYVSLFYLFLVISFAFFALGVWVVLIYAFADDSVTDDYEFQRR